MTHFAGRAARLLFLSVFIAMVLAVSAFAADVASGVGAISGSSVRMRSDASTSSSIVATLPKGAAVALIGAPSGGWYQISYAGKIGYVSADYLTEDSDGAFTSAGCVNSDGVNVRSAASASAAAVASVDSSAPVTVTGFSDGWYSVTCQYGTKGYVRSDFVNLTSAASESSTGSKLVSTARQYLGTRYVYGGSSPRGFDCSGFTMYVYQQYGVSLPHTATGQWQSGKGSKVWSASALQTGDLVFFCDPSRSAGKACSHAGIYIGGGQFIHASSARSGGVVTSSLYEDYYARYFVGGVRVF
ncbi:MAG: NlpC/P60 family protein [Oscillibacter sp.]|jgi:cell wall-associated NlpC family hydrolase|nr:NlpC/P60 family protein [Oscillibacter sp.]